MKLSNKIRATSIVLKKEKTELKSLALSIKTAKNCLKETQQKLSIINEANHRKIWVWGNLMPSTLEKMISELKIEYRHRHIAYCLTRGRKYAQIENKVKNKPKSELITKYQNKLKDNIFLREEILRINEDKIRLDEEDLNKLFGTRPTKLNCFYFGIDRSHCSSCWESSDEELHFLATTKTLQEVKKAFRRYVWDNYEKMVNLRHSSFYPNFFDSLKYKPGWDCLYFNQTGKDYCPDIEGSMSGNEYDVFKELNPETVFSKEEYASILECVEYSKKIEAKNKAEEEKREKEIAKAQKEYNLELENYEKEKKKYEDYIKLRKEFEGDSDLPIVKKPTIKKPKLPDILDPKKRQAKALKQLTEIFNRVNEISKNGYEPVKKKV